MCHLDNFVLFSHYAPNTQDRMPLQQPPPLSFSPSGLPTESKQNSLQWVPAKIHLFLSAAETYLDASFCMCIHTNIHTQPHTSQPFVKLQVTSFGFLLLPFPEALLHPSLQGSAWLRLRLRLPNPTAPTLAAPAGALTPSTPRFWPGFTSCRQGYKQLPRFHRNVSIPMKLKPILPLHPLYIGRFTKHILLLLYSKWTSWCTSSDSSYHLSSQFIWDK